MTALLTSPVFWHGIIDLIVAIAVISGRPKALLDPLARRQLFDGTQEQVKTRKSK